MRGICFALQPRMLRDDIVLERLHTLAHVAGADLAWVAEVANAGETPCFGRVWVTPSYHPLARKMRALDGRPLPDRRLLRCPGRALDDFIKEPDGITEAEGAYTHLDCQGLRVRARVGLLCEAAPLGSRVRRSAMRLVPSVVEAMPTLSAPPEGRDAELVLLYGANGRMLYVGGNTERLVEWRPSIQRLAQALERGGPAVLAGAAIDVRRLDGPEGVAHLVTLRPALPVVLPPEALLTPTQRQVAGYAAEGATVKEIADALGRHVETVRTHLREAYRRLDVGSRIDLARTLDGHMSPFVES